MDISRRAVASAKVNVALNRARVEVRHGHLFDALPDGNASQLRRQTAARNRATQEPYGYAWCYRAASSGTYTPARNGFNQRVPTAKAPQESRRSEASYSSTVSIGTTSS